MSPSMAGGIGAVTYGKYGSDGEDCHFLQTIELESGKPHWKDPVKLVAEGYSGWLGKPGGKALSISDTLVTAAYAGHNSQDKLSTDLLWVDVRTGQRLGSTDVGAEPVAIDCRLSGHAQALRDGVVAVVNCPNSPDAQLLRLRKGAQDWLLDEELEGCGQIANTSVTGFMSGEGDNMLVGCGGPTRLDYLYMVTYNSYSTSAADLDGVAVDAISTGVSGHPPTNVVTSGEFFYLPKGADGKSDGVVATKVSYLPAWQYAVNGASQVRLMAATDKGVTVLVMTPGPATLHTVTGPNRSTKGPELPPDVADALPDAVQAVRVGDYLVCGFNGIDDNETVIGVVRAEA